MGGSFSKYEESECHKPVKNKNNVANANLLKGDSDSDSDDDDGADLLVALKSHFEREQKQARDLRQALKKSSEVNLEQAEQIEQLSEEVELLRTELERVKRTIKIRNPSIFTGAYEVMSSFLGGVWPATKVEIQSEKSTTLEDALGKLVDIIQDNEMGGDGVGDGDNDDNNLLEHLILGLEENGLDHVAGRFLLSLIDNLFKTRTSLVKEKDWGRTLFKCRRVDERLLDKLGDFGVTVLANNDGDRELFVHSQESLRSKEGEPKFQFFDLLPAGVLTKVGFFI